MSAHRPYAAAILLALALVLVLALGCVAQDAAQSFGQVTTTLEDDGQ